MTDYLTKEEIRQWRSSLERITLEEFARRLGKEISNEKETNDMVDKVYKHSSEVRYVSNDESSSNSYKAERITSLAQQSFDREKELSLEKYEKELIKTINKNNAAQKAEKSLKSDKEAMKAIKAAVKAVDKISAEKKTVKKVEKTEIATKVKKAIKSTVKAEVKLETKTSKKETKTTRTTKASTKSTKSVSKKEVMPVSVEETQISFKKNLTPREQAVFEHFVNNKNQIVYAKELAQVLELPRDYVYKYIKNLRAKMNENAIQNADNGGFVLTM